MSPEEWLAKQPAGQKAPLALSPEEWLAQQDEGPKGESGFIPSIKRGGRGLASLATDIIPAMVGKATGNEEYAKKQLAEAAAYQKETERLYPAEIASYKDIGSVGDALTYIKEAIGEAIPSLIPSLITGGVGGIAARGATAAATQAAERIAVQEVTRAAAKNVLTKETLDGIRDAAISAGAKEAQKIALRSQAAGAVVGSAAQNIPDVYQNIYEATGQQDLGAALAFGGFNAALDAILPISLLSKFTKTGISPEAVAAAWYKRAGKGAVEGFVTEGGTEALQEVSSAAAEKFVDENQEFFSEKNFERFVNSGLKGGFGGAGITAATDVAFGKGPEGKKKPAKGQTILDTLAGDEDVARIDEPAGGESTEVVGGPGASPPPGGAGGTKPSRVVSTESDAGRLDAGEGQPAAALIAERFDDFKRQYNDLKQEAIEIIQLPSLSPSDERRLKLVQRDLSNVIGANSSLILNSELAQAMKDPTFDASQALQDIQRRIDTTSSSQPRAMRSRSTQPAMVDERGAFIPANEKGGAPIASAGFKTLDEDNNLDSSLAGATFITGMGTSERSKGAGTKLLSSITDWADSNGKTLALVPAASPDSALGGLSQKELKAWYARNGFEDRVDYMVRVPKAGQPRAMRGKSTQSEPWKNVSRTTRGEVELIDTNLFEGVDQRNAVDTSTPEYAALKASVAKTGIVDPITITTNSLGQPEVFEGNHRLQVARELGIKNVPVVLHSRFNRSESRPVVGQKPSSLFAAPTPRAMRRDLAGTRKDIFDLLNRALSVGRQDVGKAVEYLQGLQQRNQELLPERSKDSFWGRWNAPSVGMTTAEGFANPGKVVELYNAKQEQEIAEVIKKLQPTGTPLAMKGDLFSGEQTAPNVGTDKPESLADVFKPAGDAESSELDLENQAEFDAYRERTEKNAAIERRQSKDKTAVGASITSEERISIATAKKQGLEKQLAASQQEIKRLQELSAKYPLAKVQRRATDGTSSTFAVGAAINEEIKILQRIQRDIAGADQQISEAASSVQAPTTRVQPKQPATATVQELPGMETGELGQKKALPVSSENRDKRIELLSERKAAREAKRDEFGAPIEGESVTDQVVAEEADAEISVKQEAAPIVSTEHVAQTKEGSQIKDFFDAIKPVSATPAEQEKHAAPKNAAAGALLEFDIAKPGETTSPGVQAALRYLANRVGGINSFQELLSRLQAAPAELQSGMFKRAGLPDLTTRRGMEQFSSQVQEYLEQLPGTSDSVLYSLKKTGISPFTGKPVPYTEDISQGVGETVEFPPLKSGKPRRPEQRTVEKTYRISDVKLRTAARVLRELLQMGSKLSAPAKAAVTYLQNTNRETFGDVLRDLAFDLAMFELDPRNYGANSTFYGEGGKYARDFRTWIEQNLSADTVDRLDDLIADHKATAEANVVFEKAVSSYRKQLEERAEKLRVDTEKSTGTKIPKAPKKRISQRITETELGEQEENVEPGIPAKNLPRTRKLYEVHPAIKRAIEAGDTKLVLELMAQSKADPYFALLAQRLLDANITAKTELVSADEVSPLSNDPGIPATLDGYLTALRDLVITTLPQGKQAEIVRQLESNKIGELVEAFESINSESGNFTDGQNQLLNDAATFFDEQYNWNGKYDPGTDTIYLRVGTLTNHMFLHEAVHATAEHLLSNPDSLTGIRRQGYDQLNELFNHSKAMLSLKGLTKSTIYGLTNIHEFVSEAMTNPEFQAMLRAIRYKASGYSLMSRFTDGIRKLFKIVDTAESNVLDEVIFATDAMLMGGVAGKELMAGKPRAMAGKRIPVGRPDSKTAIKNMMTSRSWDEVQSQWPIFYSSLKASLRPIALGGLTLNQLGDLVNKRIPQVGNFIRVTEEYLSRKNQILNESGVITKRWERLQVVDPDMSRKLGAVMHRATLSEVDPDKATAQQRNDNVDLMTQWTALNPEAKQIYRDVRNFYEKRFSEYKRTLRQRVQLMRKYGVSETTINEIRNEFEKNARKGPYFPLMRYGRFWYQVGKGNDREYYMFETFGELQAHLNERLERNPNLEDSLVQGDQYQKQMDLHARESSFLKAAFNAVDNSSMGDKQGLKDELYQTWLANQPETSFRNRFIHRKAVEGFSQDALRNFSSSSFHMAYQMSRFEYSPELFSQITAARAQIKDRRDDSKRADPEIMRENNELSDYVQELERRMSTILNPEDVGSVVSLLSNVGFIYYLTSVASAATNILGGMVIGLPTLVSHQLRMNPNMSYTAATMASLGQMKNAAMQIMATGFSVDRGPRLRDNYVLFPSLDRSSSLSKMDRAAYNRFVADGVIDITAAYDQSGLASAPTAEYGGMRHRAMQAVSALFHNAERFNREVVAMSAFRTAMEKRAGYKDQQKAFTESIADAKNVTTQSMFDYSSVNKPRYMQSPAARILLQFKQFPQQMTFYLARNLQQSLAGATPEIKREARARFVGTMGMTGIFAGSTGLWGFSSAAAVVNAVMNGLGDDDEEPFDFELEYMNWASETFGKNLGMFMTRGAGNAAGVDLHSRVSLDDMWFRDGRKNTDEATALQEFLVSMLGPTAGIAVNAARAVDLYNQGHADRAIEAVSPGFIKQPLVAARYAREGVNTLKGDPLAQDIGPMDLLMQSLGFRPAEIAEIQYYNITKKGQEQAILKERQNLLNLFGISFMANDSDANEKAFEKIMKFNEKHPSAAIPARSIIKSIKERATKSAKAQHGLHIDKRLQGLIDETYIDRLTEDEE